MNLGTKIARTVSLVCALLYSPKRWADNFNAGGAQTILRAGTPQEVLGLGAGASEATVRQAHRDLAKQYMGRVNAGDPTAIAIMQRVNDAKDRLTKKPLDQAPNSGPPSREFDDRVNAAVTAEERARLRAEQIRRAATAADFVAAAAAGRPSLRAADEAVDFARAHVATFLQRSPTSGDLHALAATGVTNEGQRAIYRAALAQAYTPEQMLKLIKPTAGAATGGVNAEANLRAAVEAELPRFFDFQPNAEQVSRLRQTLKVRYGAGGDLMFDRATRPAGAASAKRGGASSLLEKPGVMNRVLGRLAKRVFAVDPSLVTGVANEVVTGAETSALDEGTCPSAFVKSGGQILTAEYRRLLALKGRDAADLVVYDCAQKNAEAGTKLAKLLEEDRRAATNALKAPGQRVRCRADQGGPKIELTLDHGQRAEIGFDSSARLGTLEITPQPKGGNPNYFLKADLARGVEVSYCAYAPKTKTSREQLRVIKESEASFLTRVTCASGGCDHLGFLERTDNADANVFSSDGTLPNEHRPFGELDKGYLNETAKTYAKLMTLIRGVPADDRSFAEVCRALGGEVPAVDNRWAAPRPTPVAPASATSAR